MYFKKLKLSIVWFLTTWEFVCTVLNLKTKQAEEQRASISIRHIETLKQKIMKLRKENESLKRQLHVSELWCGIALFQIELYRIVFQQNVLSYTQRTCMITKLWIEIVFLTCECSVIQIPAFHLHIKLRLLKLSIIFLVYLKLVSASKCNNQYYEMIVWSLFF